MKRGTQNFEEDGRGGVERGGAHQLPEIGKIHFAKHLSIVCCPVVHSMDGWMDGQVSVHVDEPCQIDGLTVETFAVDAAADDADNNDNAYMQKTCYVAEKAILAKKKLRKKCVNRDKM